MSKVNILINGGLEVSYSKAMSVPLSTYIYNKKGGDTVTSFYIPQGREEKVIKFPRNRSKFERFCIDSSDITYTDCREDGESISFDLKSSFALREYQKEPVAGVLKDLTATRDSSTVLQAEPSFGKEQPYSEPVLTPDGWVTMGELEVGSLVINRYGQPVPVVNIFEQGTKAVYRVDFADNSFTHCGLEHLWTVRNRRKNNRKEYTTTLADIITSQDCSDELLFSVPLVDAIEYSEKLLPIHPETLGVLVGDGCFRGGGLSVTNNSLDITSLPLPKGDSWHSLGEDSVYSIVGGNTKRILKALGLYGKKSIDKWIPTSYLLGSKPQRVALLKGLLATDGHIVANSTINEYSTSSKKLASSITSLARSLGYYVNWSSRVPTYTYKGVKKEGNLSYRIYIQDKRKYKTITKITKVGEENSRCIMLNTDDHTYITRDYTVTHNTFILPYIVSSLQRCTLVLVDRDLLRDQMFDEFTSNSTAKVVKLTSDTTELGDVNIATFQLLLKNERLMKLLAKEIGFTIVDECFEGETEIFTEDGWVKFKDLEQGTKVMQVNPGTLEGDFVEPSKYIKRKSDSLVKVTSASGAGVSISATAGHRQLTLTGTKEFKDLPSNFKVPCTVDVKTVGDELTPLDRLQIAFQADGSYHKNNDGSVCGYIFGFNKDRKYNRLINLLDTLEIPYSLWKPSTGGKFPRVLISKKVLTLEKSLPMTFSLSSFSKTKAQAFLEEVKLWDGYYKDLRANSIYYSSIDVDSAKLVSEIAVIAGWYAYTSKVVDKRSPKFNDVYKVSINKTKEIIGFQNATSEEVAHNDDVYCVSVPSTYIYVRQNGIPFVTGNCHVAPAEKFLNVISELPAKYRLGLSATPTRSDGLTSIITDTFGYNKVIGSNPNNLKIYNVAVETKIPVHFNNKSEYAKNFIKAMTSPIKKGESTPIELAVTSAIRLREKNRKVLVYVTYGKLQELVKKSFEAEGYSVAVIQGKTGKARRAELIRAFQNGEIDFLVSGVILQKGVSIHALDTIINLAPQNKENLEQVKGRLRREMEGKAEPMFIYFTFSGKLEYSNATTVQMLADSRDKGDKFSRVSVDSFKKRLGV